MIHAVDSRIACFISHHGFGHAARASALMSAIRRQAPGIEFDIFTRTPRWFFDRSVNAPFSYHPVDTDVGMVQTTPLHEDLGSTLERLDRFFPFEDDRIDPLAHKMVQCQCRLVICDIAPMGIAVARKAGIPSVLIENFTWDWIYKTYALKDPRFNPHRRYLREMFRRADVHIQTEPLCRRDPGADIVVPPIARKIRTPSRDMRKRIGVPEGAPLVLITMGGFQPRYLFRDALGRSRDIWFILSGVDQQRPALAPNAISIPHDSPYYHPDLVHCCDVVVAKAGYSTVAEVCQAGAKFACVLRPDFPEARILESFIRRHLDSFAMTETEFHSGDWITQGLSNLLECREKRGVPTDGAAKAATFILPLLST